jgi:uncharacterized protein
MLEQSLVIKYDRLKSNLKALGRVVAAFSGGVDSGLLSYAARQVLGKTDFLAITAKSETFPESELAEAKAFTDAYDINHRIVSTSELATINNSGNSRERCYYCKRELFSQLSDLAKSLGYAAIVEGSNSDDDNDFRPGRRAIRELGVISPLKDAGLTKADIRAISREEGLPTWDKPAYACLTSRFPYGVTIDERSLRMIEKAEIYLKANGFRQCRVRCFGEKAVVEVEPDLVSKALGMKDAIVTELLGAGFGEVEIDPLGYRMGRMNNL